MNQIPLPPREGETMLIPRPASEDEALLHMIERLARDPSVDLDRFERLVEMREKIKAQGALVAYNEALAHLQGELPAVIKTGEIKIGPGAKAQTYAKLEDVIKTLKPLCAAYGFSVQYDVTYPDSKMCVTTIVGHAKGHVNKTSIILPYDTSGSKNAAQSVGSTISYGRRYGLLAQFNIAVADEDDDAQSAAISELISAQQLLELENLVESTGSDMALFCKRMKVPNLDSLPVSRLHEAMDLLELKRRANERNKSAPDARES